MQRATNLEGRPGREGSVDMETGADHREEASGEYPSWVLLETSRRCEAAAAAPATAAEARTSKGRPVRVSFNLAPPPAFSRLHVDGFPDGEDDGDRDDKKILAAHGDSVLVQVPDKGETPDYFVYNAGGAPSRPPSLSLLPACYLPRQTCGRPRSFFADTVAVLRRGDEELAVVVAGRGGFVSENLEEGGAPVQAHLLLLRSGEHWGSEWEFKWAPVLHDESKRVELLNSWMTDAVVPVGDRFLCWVDYHRGVIFADVWNETPELRHVPLPVDAERRRRNFGGNPASFYRAVCAAGDDEVRFVHVSPRCCCGCPGATACERSRRAFTITTWTLRMDSVVDCGILTWEKLGMVLDCDDIWSLAGDVPRVRPEFPMASLDDPDVLCFMMRRNAFHDADVDGDLAIRLVEIDTRRMELRSVFRYDHEDDSFTYDDCPPTFLPGAVSKYFNVSSSRHTAAKASQRRRHRRHILEAPAKPLSEPASLEVAAAMASPEEMLATLREIPDLASSDMLRAYGVLACDESRQFRYRSLLALPMDMRKDYCLVMAKLSCFNI